MAENSSNEGSYQAVGGTAEEPPSIEALSLQCGFPRALQPYDLFRTRAKARSGNAILETREWQLSDGWNLEDVVAEGDSDKFVPIHICVNEAVLNQSVAISVEKFPGSCSSLLGTNNF